jgi:replicative DNA helicase
VNVNFPHDLPAERDVLGACLLDAECAEAAADTLRPEGDFYADRHAAVWAAVVALRADRVPIDTLSVTSRLEAHGTLERVVPAEYLLGLTDTLPLARGLEARCARLRDLAVAREVMRAALSLVAEGSEPIEDVREYLDRAEGVMQRATAGRRAKGEPVLLARGIEAELQRWSEGKRTVGYPTGFRQLDYYTGGFVPGLVEVMAARPGMGKTAFGLERAIGCARATGHTAYFASLEMPLRQIALRTISADAGIESTRLRDVKLNAEDMRGVTDTLVRMEALPVYVDDTPAVNANDVRRNVRNLIRKRGPVCCVVVDYLQLMRPVERCQSRELEVASVSRDLMMLAKELQVPVLALAQLNREVEKRGDKRPTLADLRESGAIEQDASVVTFIYRDEVYNDKSEDKGTAEIIIGKNRNGPAGGMVRVSFRGEFTRFAPLRDYEGAEA